MLYKMFSFVASLRKIGVKLPKYIVRQIFCYLNFADICSLPEIKFIQPNISVEEIFRSVTYDRNPKMYAELVRKYPLSTRQYKLLARIGDVSLLKHFACDLVKLLKILIREPRLDSICCIVLKNLRNPKVDKYLYALMEPHRFYIFKGIVRLGHVPQQTNLEQYLYTACHYGLFEPVQFLLQNFEFEAHVLQKGIAYACETNHKRVVNYLREFVIPGACGNRCLALCK